MLDVFTTHTPTSARAHTMLHGVFLRWLEVVIFYGKVFGEKLSCFQHPQTPNQCTDQTSKLITKGRDAGKNRRKIELEERRVCLSLKRLNTRTNVRTNVQVRNKMLFDDARIPFLVAQWAIGFVCQ